MSALAPSAAMSLPLNAAPMAPPAPQPAQADHGFARCLDQARDDNGAAPADDAAQRSGVKKKPLSNPRAERDAREPRRARADGGGEATPKAASEGESDNPTTHATHTDAAAPDLAALLPGWAPVPTAMPAAADASAAEGSASSPTSAVLGSVKASAPGLQNDPAAQALPQLATATAATEIDSPSATATLASSAELQAAASELRSATPELPSTLLPATPLSTPVAAATAPSASKAAEPPLPTAALPAPIDSAAFAPSLATQLRWWASDGVQQAQLLLNPAEMGPVAVKILLDGREARIDFSADLAATRNAIEAALPVLAAALDDSGLRLAGGGVHDGSAQRQPEWSARGAARRTASGTNGSDIAAPATAPRGAITRGMVDLVA